MPTPLDLTAEVTDPTGTTYRWSASDPSAKNRLRNLSFSTKIGEGFSSAQGQLARRIDLEYPDLNLVDEVAFVGVDGSVAWEGRVSALPRELSDSHSIGVTLTGHMAHAKDRKFQEIYVDRDLGAWGQMSVGRRANLLASSFGQLNAPSTQTDETTSLAGVLTSINGAWVSPWVPISEAWYDAGGTIISKIVVSWNARGSTTMTSAGDAGWTWLVGTCTNDVATGFSSSGDLQPNGTTFSNATFTPAFGLAWRYGLLQFTHTTPGGLDGAAWGVTWQKLAVYGNHGLTTITGEPGEPAGVLASDVIKDIASRWCPQFNTDGVQSTNYVIQHLAFKDRTFPYDAFLEINKYHLWNLAVWENKTLTFAPYDLTDYDWEIRTDDPGTTFSPQGPSVDDLAGGIAVTYTDALTNVKTTLTPDTNPDDLLDKGPSNPWNAHGINQWAEIELSTPTTSAQALQLGRAALADRNTPKTPGTITVKGYIRDRQGNEQPVWKVRAGDTISVTNFPNDTPRLIVETSYDDSNKSISLSIDRPFALLDAYIDRAATALQARGLS